MTDQMPKPTGLSKPTVGNDDFFNQDFSKFGQPEKNLEVSAGDLGVGLAGSALRGTGTGIAEIGLSDLVRAGSALSDKLPGTQVLEYARRKLMGESEEEQAAKKADALDKITGAVTDPVDNAIIKPIVNPIGSAIKEGGETLIDRGTSDDYKEALRGREIFTGNGVSDFGISDSAGDPAVWAAKFTDGIGSLGGTLAVGALTGGTVKALVKKQMLKRGASMALADETARLAGIKWGQRGAMAEGVNMSTGQSADQARSQVESLSWDQLLTSKTFNDQVKEISRDPQFEGATATDLLNEARRRTADYAASIAKSDPKTWAAAAAGTLLGDAALFKMLQGTGAKGLAAGALQGMAGEGLGEAVEEGTQQYIGNEATNQAGGQNIDPMSGVVQAAATAGTIGALSGGGVGAIGGARGAMAPQDEQAANIGEQPSDPQESPQASAVPEFDSALAEVNAIERKTYGQHSIGRDGNKFRGAYVDELGNVQITPAYSKIEDVRAAMGWPVHGQTDNTGSQPMGSDEFANVPAFQRQDGGRFKGWAEDSDVQRALAGEFGASVQEIIAAQMQSGDQGKTLQERVLAGELGHDPFAGGKSAMQVGMDNAPLALPQKDIIYAGDANAKQPGTEVAPPGAFDDKQAGPGPQFRGSERTRWQDGQEGDVLPPEAAGNPAGALPGRVIEGEAREVGTELPYRDVVYGRDGRAQQQAAAARGQALAEQNERFRNAAPAIGHSGTIFAPGTPGADNKNSAYTPPRISRDQVDNSLGEQSIRDPRTDAGQAIQQAGSESDAIFGQLKSLRITKRGKPFASQKEAQLASRKTETPIALPAGGFGVVDKAELEQAQANQASVKQPSSNAGQLGQSAAPTAPVMNEGTKQPEADNAAMPKQLPKTEPMPQQEHSSYDDRLKARFNAISNAVSDGEIDEIVNQQLADKERDFSSTSSIERAAEKAKRDIEGKREAEQVESRLDSGQSVFVTTKPSGQAAKDYVVKANKEDPDYEYYYLEPTGERQHTEYGEVFDHEWRVLKRKAQASPNQSIRQADQTVKSIDHAKQNTAPAPDAGVSVSGTPRFTIEPLTDKSIIVKGDKNDAELKGRVEAAWPKAKPLYNERHKGWVFSSKREGVVREALADLLAPVEAKANVVGIRPGVAVVEVSDGEYLVKDPKGTNLATFKIGQRGAVGIKHFYPGQAAEKQANAAIAKFLDERDTQEAVAAAAKARRDETRQVPWSEIQDRNEGTTPDADEAMPLLAAMQYGNKTLNDYVDVKAKSAEIIQQMKGVYDLYAHMDAAMRDAGYEFGKSDRERLMGNYLDMDEMTARDISNMKTKGILSDGKTRVVDVPDGGSMFDAGKLLRNEYSKADVLAVLAKLGGKVETGEKQSPATSSIPRATDYPDAKSYRQAMLEYYNQNPRSERPVNTIAENMSKLDRKIENAEKRLQEQLRKQSKPGLTPPAIIQNAIDNIRDEIKSLRAERKSIVGSEDFTPRDGWESNLQAAREYANHLRKTGQISEGAALKAWGKLESLVGLITNATAPAGKTVDFSKAKTVKAQLDMWDSLEAGDRVIDVKGIDRGSVFSKMKSRRIVQLTDQFNKRDEFSIAAITGGGSDIVAQLEARHAVNNPQQPVSTDGVMTLDQLKQLRIDTINKLAQQEADNHSTDDRLQRKKDQLDRAIAEVEAQTKADLSGSDREQKTDGVDRVEFKDVHPIINEETEALAQKLGAFLAKGDKAGAQAAFDKWLKEKGLFVKKWEMIAISDRAKTIANQINRGDKAPSKPEGKLDKAAQAIKDKKREKAEKLKRLLQERKGTLNAGIDPEVMIAVAELGALSVADGAVRFAQFVRDTLASTRDVGIDDADVKPFLKEAYGAIASNPEKYGVSDEVADQMDLPRDVRRANLDEIVSNEQREDSQPKAKPEDEAKKLRTKLRERLYLDLRSGIEIANNNDLKKAAANALGIKPADVTPLQLKEAQEAYEAAAANVRREQIQKRLNAHNGQRAAFDYAVDEYGKQPNLDVRTANSSDLQAYSTPAPMALLANLGAGIHAGTTVYEPTAGNGLLLLTGDQSNTYANELDPERADALAWSGFNVTILDATNSPFEGAIPGQVDAVVANPPFGKLRDANGKPTKITFEDPQGRAHSFGELDHVIAKNALDAMKDDGKATLILGAPKEAGDYTGNNKAFLNWLYSNYNVVHHIEVDGDLYKGQGAGWPTQMIVIHGRETHGTGKFAPFKGEVKRLDNWSDIYDSFNGIMDTQGNNYSARPGHGNVLSAYKPGAEPGTGDGRHGKSADRSDRGSVGSGKNGSGRNAGSRGGKRGSAGQAARGSFDSQPDIGQGGLGKTEAATATIEGGGATAAATDGVGLSGQRNDHAVSRKQFSPKPIVGNVNKANEFQAYYQTASNGFNDAVLTPVNMASYTQTALAGITERHGSVDGYVADRLGYKNPEQLHNAFMGLQADAVAMAVDAIERDRAIIIGDQTGVGKGRQAAGVIRYALQQGMTPIFITQKPNLFTDMYDDLVDIGVEGFKPLIMNQDNGFVSKGDDKLFDLPARSRRLMLERTAIDGKLPDGYNGLFLTYSQISSDKNGDKLNVLNRLAGNAILVMDESHTASGGDSKLGKAFQGLVTDAKGVVYLSATYAKRPDNMQLYTRTDMGLAVENKSELVSIIQGGGIGMQTYIAGKLSEAGQMVRRERSFDGISITNRVLPDKNGDVARQFDDVTEALRAIQDMSTAWRDYVESDIAKKIQIESGMDTLIAGNQADTKVNVTLFSSVIHNYIAQLSLGLKAKQTAQLAIESIKQGKRPVIALENTMGAALESYMERNFKRIGDTADDLTYGNLLKSIADGVLAYRVKEPGSTESRRVLVPIDNVDSPYIKMMYNRVMDLADNLNVDVPASPIDAIRHELTRAGYSVAEITGRSELVDYGNNSTISRRPADELDRRSVVDRFNSGKLDVLILNQAGSTGLSIHASERFDDQNQRHMIVAQPSLDINTFMQMLGRVNRTGQVKKPTYDLAWLDLPSEMRPAAVLSRKMTSLNANTSGNTDSATSIESVDLLNVYGDQVVTDYVKENYDQLAQYSSRLVQLPDEDAAVYFLGKLAVMPVKVQKQVLEQLEENYRNLIEYLDATGQNELNMTEMDLDAKPVEQLRVSEGRDGAGVFSEPTYVTKVDVKAQGKAPTWDEVKAELEQSGQDEFDKAVSRMMDDTAYEARLRERINKLKKEIDTLSAEGKKTDVAMDDKLKIEVQLSSFANAKMEIASKFGRGGMFAHGSVVRVKLPENETAVTGVVVSVKYSHGSGNPASQSKWKVGIMLADRVRKLPLALTQADQMIEGTRRESEDGLKSIFDRAASLPAREHRYIMTGNLIEAQSRSAEKGRIVPFTTNDGRVIQGMLMPKKFKPESSLRDKVSVTPDQAFGWLANTNDGVLASLGLTTNDGEVTLRRERWGSQFTLEMPKAVSKGKKYWGNPRMVEIIGEQAVKGNGKLEIKLSREDARRVTSVMDVINPLGIYNQAQISDFNQMTGKNVPTFQKDSIKFSLSKHSDAAPGTRGMTKPELEMVATDWSKQYKGAASARIIVAANQAEMNEMLGMVGAAVPDGQSVNAAYLPGHKTLLLNAEAIQSPKRARELMRHELLAHHGLREVVGDDAYISIIEAVKRGKDISGIKDAYYQVAENYTDMHPDVQAEEVFAHWMEKQPDRGELAIWWRGIVRRVKDALRAVGLVGERTTEEEFNRVLDAIATGMRNGRKPGRRVMESWHDAPAYSKNDALFSLGTATADQSIIGKAESLAKAAPSSVLNWIKEQRGVGLGALTDLQIDQIYRGVTGGAVSRYQKLRANMEADRNDILLDAETRIDPLWDALGKEQKKALSNLMHDATMARLHPDQSLADNSLYQEVKQKLERATKPSTKAEYQSELDTIIANHKHLAERYNLGLNKEGKALYQTMRETYDKQWADLRDAIEQRLEDMMGTEGKTLAAELRLQMEHALQHGPYFPLARFGDYVVKASKGDEHIREHFERRKDAEQAIKQYQRDGYNAVMTVKEEGNGGQANSNALGLKVMQLLDQAGESGASASSIKDDVWQAMLQMLPDASFAKHAIHRRRVKGASRDGHRAYLNSVYHYAHHVSKIRYGHQMQAELNKMNEQIQAGVRGEESNIKPEDLEVAQQVLNEMNKRHELNMNPKGAKWTGWAGNLGFMWYMAGSPASAIINMTQNFTVMLPQLGAKYGFGKASAAMVKAMFDYGKHGKFKAGTKEAWVSLTRADSGITSDEKALLNSLYKAGALDLTQAHSVAARADTDLQDVKPGAAWKRKTMAWLGSMFHNAEVLNREVAALAAYRLLKEQSPNLTAEQYADQVTEMVYDGHGNYAASNRPRYMRGDVAKVLTQFKIYSQMMTYTIYRNAYLAAKGDKVALKTLGGVLGTHFIMAGVMGLPFPITAAIYAIAAAADDDDDRTGKASFRLGLAETMGPDLGELVARGPMDAVTGLSIAGRTGINDLWFREPKEGAEGDDLAWHVTQQIAGPVLGIGVQAARGLSMMSDGDYQRGAETMMPKALKDLAKSYRQASDGEQTRKGDVIIDDVSAFNVAMQAMGFGNAEMAKAYDAREYIKGKEGRIEDERSKLMSDYFMARKDGDDEAMADVMARIREFNASHYRTEAITSRTLRQSLKSKQRAAHRTQGGVYLSRNREYLRGEGAFIGDGGTATN